MSDFLDDPFPDRGNLEVRSGTNLCDFCSPPQPSQWKYPCKSFRLPMPPLFGGRPPMSDGAWGACEVCAALIEADDRVALVKRVNRKDLILLIIQGQVIDLFMKYRDGLREFEGAKPSEFWGEVKVKPEGEWE